MQPRGKICAESEGGVNKICHFLYFLPEIHANTPKNIGKAMVAEQNREKAKRRENGMKSNNQINIPQAREAMDKFKMQAASEVGVNLTNGYNGHLAPSAARWSRRCGPYEVRVIPVRLVPQLGMKSMCST